MLRRLFAILWAISLAICVIILLLSMASNSLPPAFSQIEWGKSEYRRYLSTRRGAIEYHGFDPSHLAPAETETGRYDEEHRFLWLRANYVYLYGVGDQNAVRHTTVEIHLRPVVLILLILPGCRLITYLRRRQVQTPAAQEAGAELTPLENDIPCVRCAYNLRGLGLSAHCPECGLGVQRSLTLGRELAESRPAWIWSLSRGAALIAASQVFIAIMIQSMTLLEHIGTNQSLLLLGAASLAVASSGYCIGSWLLTRRENPHALKRPHRRLSFFLRLCSLGPLLAGLSLLLIAAAFAWWETQYVSRPFPYSGVHGASEQISLFLMVTFLPCPLLQFILMRRLAMRVLNSHLTEHTTIVAIGHPLTVAALFVWHWAFSVNLVRNVDLYVTTGLWIAFLLFWLWSVYVHAFFAVAFRRAARAASASWQAADAGTVLV